MGTHDPLVGTDLGSYRLVRVLGEGGMGRVYAAVHPSSGSRVAIKLIAERFANDKELLGRFFAEARAVNLIRHENIVNIVDLAELPDGRPFIVMELVTGLTLRQLGSSKPIGGIVNLVIEVLAGLAAAHAIGIVHRDLKPDNILVTASGHAKLLDFGIAKLSKPLPNAPSLRTQTGVVLGTPEYMAPEMVVGDVVDGRADLYAIGVILYELLTGRRPFLGGTDFDVMRAHVDQPVIPPRQLRPDIPEPLEAIVMRALAKRPADRFEHALAMQKALRRVALELFGDGQWKPLLGDWLPPAAMTESMRAPSKQEVATVRARGLGQKREIVAPPNRKRVHVVVPVVVAVAACTSIAVVVLTREDERPAPAADAASPIASPIASPVVIDAALAIDAAATLEPAWDVAPEDASLPSLPIGKRSGGEAASVAEPRVELAPATPADARWRAAMAEAHTVAYRSLRDAWLVEIEFPRVDADGGMEPREFIAFRFRGPQGASWCASEVRWSHENMLRSASHTRDCDRPAVRAPRCGLQQARAKLSARFPELASGRHTLLYRENRWVAGDKSVSDDCGKVTMTSPSVRTEYDRARFDWRAFLAPAKLRAMTVAADAKLVAIVLDPVAADGTIDLRSGGSTSYVFRSQQRTAAGSGCTITVSVAATVDVNVEHVGCMAPLTSDPACTAEQVLAQAKAVEPPVQLRFHSGTWHVGKERVADNCP